MTPDGHHESVVDVLGRERELIMEEYFRAGVAFCRLAGTNVNQVKYGKVPAGV